MYYQSLSGSLWGYFFSQLFLRVCFTQSCASSSFPKCCLSWALPLTHGWVPEGHSFLIQSGVPCSFGTTVWTRFCAISISGSQHHKVTICSPVVHLPWITSDLPLVLHLQLQLRDIKVKSNSIPTTQQRSRETELIAMILDRSENCCQPQLHELSHGIKLDNITNVTHLL